MGTKCFHAKPQRVQHPAQRIGVTPRPQRRKPAETAEGFGSNPHARRHPGLRPGARLSLVSHEDTKTRRHEEVSTDTPLPPAGGGGGGHLSPVLFRGGVGGGDFCFAPRRQDANRAVLRARLAELDIPLPVGRGGGGGSTPEAKAPLHLLFVTPGLTWGLAASWGATTGACGGEPVRSTTSPNGRHPMARSQATQRRYAGRLCVQTKHSRSRGGSVLYSLKAPSNAEP